MGESRPSRADEISLRYDAATPTSKAAIIVTGLDDENLQKLCAIEWTPDRWADLLSLSVDLGTGKPPLPVAGRYRVVDGTLLFEPRFAIEPALKHQARFDPSRLPIPRNSPEQTLAFADRPAPEGKPASVLRVEPSGDVLPENLLKFYVHFSSPMSRGEVYKHVRLRDAKGKTVEAAFLEIGEELWDISGTRITLLLDPGRIKRGLVPHEEDGPILQNGHTYTLQVDRQWPDASGRPMIASFSKTFRAEAADRSQPDPKTWTIRTPGEATREPLAIMFPEPLDRAMIDHALTILDAQGRPVRGKVTVDAGSNGWRFTPEHPWSAGLYTIEVDPDLEDLAGNSVARPFEVDAQAPASPAKPVRLPITIPASTP